MDTLNERRVYDLLLQSTARPNTPQYFLLTPKVSYHVCISQNLSILLFHIVLT